MPQWYCHRIIYGKPDRNIDSVNLVHRVFDGLKFMDSLFWPILVMSRGLSENEAVEIPLVTLAINIRLELQAQI